MKLLINLLFIILLICCKPNDEEFNLCSGSLHPYYYPSLKYKGGFYEIKKHFYENYKPTYGEKDTGIIRIQFQVNCHGETGNYKIQSYNLNYTTTRLSDKITKQLLLLTKGLKEWIPATNDMGENIDSHKFFAFKLVDGKLKDILPK